MPMCWRCRSGWTCGATIKEKFLTRIVALHGRVSNGGSRSRQKTGWRSSHGGRHYTDTSAVTGYICFVVESGRRPLPHINGSHLTDTGLNLPD